MESLLKDYNYLAYWELGYVSPLTACPLHEIMIESGMRSIRVKSFTPSSIEENHERLQSQGGRRVGAG